MQTNKLLYFVIILQIILILLVVLSKNQLFGNERHYQEQSVCDMDGKCKRLNDEVADHTMHNMMNDMTERMENKSGDELDKVFLEDMIIHHQGAVDMALELQEGTQRPELQSMASDIIDAQTKEIDIMKGWLDSWF